MKKIPSLFVRDYERNIVAALGYESGLSNKGRFLATEEITQGCKWVLAGEGVATRKWDGAAVLVNRGVLYKRFDAKHGKPLPNHFEPCQDPDPITGHWPGWVPVYEHLPENKWIIEAFSNTCEGRKPNGLPDGTYEAIGPKINGNKDSERVHLLKKHGEITYTDLDVSSYESIKGALSVLNIEGIVFHHPDGRMCKVKRSDFGLKW